MKGAKGVLINITGGLDMTLHEVDEAANRIREEVDADANIIFGSTFDATMQGRMRVSVVATGIAAMAAQQPAPNYLDLDMNRPMQTGQPALSRPVAPPVGRVAMPAAAVAAAPPAPVARQPAPAAPPSRRRSWRRPRWRPRRLLPPAMPAPVDHAGAACSRRASADAGSDRSAGRDESAGRAARGSRRSRAPAPAPSPPRRRSPAPRRSRRRRPRRSKPLVDETDWRVCRPATRPAVRASEPIARPWSRARSAAESRAPNLFQRITGAFAAPRPRLRGRGTDARRCEPGRSRPCRTRRRMSSPSRPSRRRVRRRCRPRSASTSPSGPSPRGMTTTCKFRRSCVAKPTDAGLVAFSTHL